MKKIIVSLLLVIATAYSWYGSTLDSSEQAQSYTRVAPAVDAEYILGEAYKHKRSDIQVQGWGTVKAILADDTTGSRHQKFILRLSSGQTLLVAHNIDLAPRIEGLQRGDKIAFYGEYEWNERGGVMHWTHRDPAGRHADGWLEHNGRRYE